MNQNYEIHEYRGIIKEYQPNINHNSFPTVKQINKIFSNRDDSLTNGFRIILENPKTFTDITFFMSHSKAVGVATDVDVSDLKYNNLVQIQGTHNPENNLYTAIGMQKYDPNEKSLQNKSLMSLTFAQQQQSQSVAKNNRQAHKKVIDIVRSSAAKSAMSMTAKLRQHPNLQQSMFTQSSSAISFVHRSVPAPIPMKSSSANGFSINNISNKLGNFANHLKSKFKDKMNNKNNNSNNNTNNTFINKDDSVMPRKGSREYLKSSASASVSASMRNSMRASLSKSIMDSVHSVKSTPNNSSSLSNSKNSLDTNSIESSQSVKSVSSNSSVNSSILSKIASSNNESPKQSLSNSVSNISLDVNAMAQSESIAQAYSTKLNKIFNTSNLSKSYSQRRQSKNTDSNSKSIETSNKSVQSSINSNSSSQSSISPRNSAIASIQDKYHVPLSAATLKYTLMKHSLSQESSVNSNIANSQIASSSSKDNIMPSSTSTSVESNIDSIKSNNNLKSSLANSLSVNSSSANQYSGFNHNLSNKNLSSISLKSDSQIKKAYLSIINNKHITKNQMQDALRDVDRLEGWDDFFAKDEKNFMHQLNNDLDRILTNSGVTYPLSYNNIPNVSLFKKALSTGESNQRSKGNHTQEK